MALYYLRTSAWQKINGAAKKKFDVYKPFQMFEQDIGRLSVTKHQIFYVLFMNWKMFYGAIIIHYSFNW